ncbi:MAG: class I SAM-dependent methyltransferase [Flavobacteriales bacterium]
MDIIGKAATNYFFNKDPESIQLFIDGYADAEMPPSVFFRTHSKLKSLEQDALSLCRGKTLDVGACAGNYSLELIKQGIEVTSLDVSPLLCKIMVKRNLPNVVQQDIMHLTREKYDTILLMMNGFGIAREMRLLPTFLGHLKSLLAPGGQILGDTTDIHYFEADKKIRGRKSKNKAYIGDVEFRLSYKGENEEFLWVYPDPDALSKCAIEAGLQPLIAKKGRDFSYLMKLVNRED